MKRVWVNFREERLELEVPEDRLVAHWNGPEGASPADVDRLIAEALEHPRSYPSLRQAVVPGDRVVIAFDPEVDTPRAVLGGVCRILVESGVEPGSITVLVPESPAGDVSSALAEGVGLVVHDPRDRTALAYLANTEQGRRVYLNRLVTDADFVLPVGRLGYDPVLGYRGPWSTLFPRLSDEATAQAYRTHPGDLRPDADRPLAAFTEAAEVSWLLGSQFHLGVVPGVSGPAEVVAGLDSAVRLEGARGVDAAWSFRPDSRAELVLVGIGRPGFATTLDDLAEGLANAARLVQRGGKIVALSRAEGVLGPALRRLALADDPRAGASSLGGLEAEPDYPTARSLARSLGWADVYLLSALGPDDVEALSMIPLDRPEEAGRLVRSTGSCILVSQADLARADVVGDS